MHRCNIGLGFGGRSTPSDSFCLYLFDCLIWVVAISRLRYSSLFSSAVFRLVFPSTKRLNVAFAWRRFFVFVHRVWFRSALSCTKRACFSWMGLDERHGGWVGSVLYERDDTIMEGWSRRVGNNRIFALFTCGLSCALLDTEGRVFYRACVRCTA